MLRPLQPFAPHNFATNLATTIGMLKRAGVGLGIDDRDVHTGSKSFMLHPDGTIPPEMRVFDRTPLGILPIVARQDPNFDAAAYIGHGHVVGGARRKVPEFLTSPVDVPAGDDLPDKAELAQRLAPFADYLSGVLAERGEELSVETIMEVLLSVFIELPGRLRETAEAMREIEKMRKFAENELTQYREALVLEPRQWLEILTSDLSVTFLSPDRDDFSYLGRAIQRYSKQLGPSGMILRQMSELRFVFPLLLKILQPEASLRFRGGEVGQLRRAVMANPLLSRHPQLATEIAKLVEVEVVQRGAKCEGFNFRELLGVCSEEAKGHMADLLVAVINAEGETGLLLEALGDEKLFLLNSILDAVTGRRVLVLSNQGLINAVLSEEWGSLLNRDPVGYEAREFDLEEKLESVHELRRFILRNPSPATVEVLIGLYPREDLRNHLKWLLRHIPKGSGTRDRRRALADVILIDTVQEFFADSGDLHEQAQRHGFDRFASLDQEGQFDLRMEGYERWLILKAFGFDPAQVESQASAIRGFIGTVVLALDRGHKGDGGVQQAQAMAQAFTDLCVVIGSLWQVLPRLSLASLSADVKEGQKRAGRREILTAEDVSAVAQKIEEAMLADFFERAGIAPRLKAHVQRSYRDPKSPLRRDGMLIRIAAYHAFQTPEGQKAVVDFLSAMVQKNRKLGLEEATIPVALNVGHTGLAGDFIEVLDSIFTHLGVDGVEGISHADLAEIVGRIEQSLRLARPIGGEQLKVWQDEIARLGPVADYPGIAELPTDIARIATIQESRRSGPAHAAVEFDLSITGDLTALALAGERPFATCQRLSSPGEYNANGEPLRRALETGMYLATLNRRDTGEPWGRAIVFVLERTPKIVLVEHVYLVGGVDRDGFDLELLRALATQPDVAFVVLADRSESRSFKPDALIRHIGFPLKIRRLPQVYWDTFFPHPNHMWIGILMAVLRAEWRENPGWLPF